MSRPSSDIWKTEIRVWNINMKPLHYTNHEKNVGKLKVYIIFNICAAAGSTELVKVYRTHQYGLVRHHYHLPHLYEVLSSAERWYHGHLVPVLESHHQLTDGNVLLTHCQHHPILQHRQSGKTSTRTQIEPKTIVCVNRSVSHHIIFSAWAISKWILEDDQQAASPGVCHLTPATDGATHCQHSKPETQLFVLQ